MFQSARLKLTAWYLLIIMFISLTFSAIIYRGLVNEVERFERAQRFRIERGLNFPHVVEIIQPNQELIDEIKWMTLELFIKG